MCANKQGPPVLKAEEGQVTSSQAVELHEDAVAQIAHHAAGQEGVQGLSQAR